MTHLRFDFHNYSLEHALTAEAAQNIAQRVQGGTYGFFDVLTDKAGASALTDIAKSLQKKFDHFVILGTGGSSLGAQTLGALKNNPFTTQSPSLYFLNNVDPATIDHLLNALPLEKTLFVTISKSGSTAETLCQTLCFIKELEAINLKPADHFLFLTEEKDSPMQRLADSYGLMPLAHDKRIGGRFSIFSNVGLLPAALQGVDIEKLICAAQKYLDDFCHSSANHPAAMGSLFAYQGIESGKPISVMMPYLDALYPLAQWYGQLWAESLGKDGKGSTPVAALGTVDQHSQLQLYHDGPDDKIYTFLVQEKDTHAHISPKIPSDPTLSYLQDRTMGDLLSAEAKATTESLIKVNRPVRTISFEALNEGVLGELLAHFMLETIITAELLQIDAFNQPGVEQSKILTRHYLAHSKKAS